MKGLWISIFAFCLMMALFNVVNRIDAAEHYPVKPITFIVPLEAGADGDIMARPMAQKVSALLGQPVVVINKPGAGSSIGYRETYSAKPDGYTICYAMATIMTNKLQGILPYDHQSFTILGVSAVSIPIVVATTKGPRPFKTIQEVFAFAKSHPGEVTIATSGIGQSWWIATVAFQEGTGLKFNIIPQPGAGGYAIAQVAGGHTDLGVTALFAARPQIDAGNVRFLGLLGSKRAPGYEHVPTVMELGYDVNWESPQVIIGPPKMPKDITDRLVKTFEAAATDPEYKKFLFERNAMPMYLPPDKALEYLNEQTKVSRAVMEKAGILKEAK